MKIWSWFRRRGVVAASREGEPIAIAERPGESWHVFGASVRGASHERAGSPNQDAIDWRPGSATGPPLLLALADGHGSSKCFRSKAGASFAVETALDVLEEFSNVQRNSFDPTLAKRVFQEDLPLVIERKWKEKVYQDLERNPLRVNEVARVEDDSGVSSRKAVEQEPVLAYGTTLLAIVLHESFLGCLQLGDGDILVVSLAGEVSRPMEDDARLLANETTSLSARQAWEDFRACFQMWRDAPPALVLASTDGYSNAFSSKDGFLAVGSDLLNLLRSEGVDKVTEDLESWLQEASREGSGDDVTVGIMVRMAVLNRDQHLQVADHTKQTDVARDEVPEPAEGAIEGGDFAGEVRLRSVR